MIPRERIFCFLSAAKPLASLRRKRRMIGEKGADFMQNTHMLIQVSTGKYREIQEYLGLSRIYMKELLSLDFHLMRPFIKSV